MRVSRHRFRPSVFTLGQCRDMRLYGLVCEIRAREDERKTVKVQADTAVLQVRHRRPENTGIRVSSPTRQFLCSVPEMTPA
jgi:hypothetical protein